MASFPFTGIGRPRLSSRMTTLCAIWNVVLSLQYFGEHLGGWQFLIRVVFVEMSKCARCQDRFAERLCPRSAIVLLRCSGARGLQCNLIRLFVTFSESVLVCGTQKVPEV